MRADFKIDSMPPALVALAVAVATAGLPALGQSPAAAAPAVAGPEPEEPDAVRVYLMEGSVISGTFTVDALTVKTAFGTLDVPVEHVVSFTPGLDSHPQLQKRIGRLIQQLGANDAVERDQAQRELAELGPGVRPQLEPHRNDEDAERRARIEAILNEFDMLEEESTDGEATTLVAEDTVETDRFTVVGRIAPETFRIETPFGPLTIALKDIRYVSRETSQKPEVRSRTTIDGNNLVQTGLKETSVRLERGDRVLITATGQIVLSPFGNNVTSGPDGAGQNVPQYAPGIASGALLGRVGRNGEEFLVGSKGDFVAKTSGTLFLGVAMTHQFANQGYAFPGTYDVRVRVNPPER